jgi:hypothetical protein
MATRSNRLGLRAFARAARAPAMRRAGVILWAIRCSEGRGQVIVGLKTKTVEQRAARTRRLHGELG